MRLSVGPIQYFWERERVLAFYEQVAQGPADIVYLGETICSKRRLVRLADWLAIGRRLVSCGKEVVLSTLALMESASEVGFAKKLCANGEFRVEANDVTAIQLLSAAGAEFVTGPGVNIYNHRTLRLLAAKGMRRWVLPVELGLSVLADLQAARPPGVETEVLALGRLPLAYSARCYTARSHNLPKDDCQFKCLEYPDGRLLKTREDQDFLVLNGVQTQSALTHTALRRVPDLAELGVDVLRISPQHLGSPRIIEIFDAARRGCNLDALQQELLGLLPTGACDGYLTEQPGMTHDDSQAA